MKKFLSVLLAVVMIASLVAVMVVPASAEGGDGETRKVTADDAYVTVSHTGGGAANKDALIDGVVPDGETIYGVGSVSWFPAASGDYATIHLNDQITLTELVLYGTGNWSAITVEVYDTAGTKNFTKTVWLQGAGTIETHTLVENGTAAIEARTIKIIGHDMKWNDGKTDKVCEVSITGHFHDFGEPTSSVEPSCGIAGSANYSCGCGITKVEPIEKTNAHIWNTTPKETVPSNETEEGYNAFGCTVPGCPDTKIEKLPCTGHNITTERVEPDCENAGYIKYTCNDDGCDYELTVELAALNHIPATESEVYQKATIWCNETLSYECQRAECNGKKLVELPNTMLKNPDEASFLIGLDNVTFTQDDSEAEGTVSANRNPEALFDRQFEKNYWGPTNFWSGVKGSKLIMEFDKEYILMDATMYVADNYNTVKVQFFNADGEEVGVAYEGIINNGASFDPISLSGNVKTQFVKKIVITVVSAKNPQATQFTEFEIIAHACQYDEEDMENVVEVPELCKTTFDGTCSLCDIRTTGVVVYDHEFEKVAGSDEIKIYTDREGDLAPTCYTTGNGYKLCTVCEAKEDVFLEATGNHDFENGEVKYRTAPTCGEAGVAYKLCATEGCAATSEDYDVDPTGLHKNYNWKELEGQESDYTHEGVKGYLCGVCGYQDTSKGTQVSPVKSFSCIAQRDWTVRYTDFTSPKATFKINLKNIQNVEDEYSVKVFGVVKKGDVVKEVQIYGDGATGKMMTDGTFSLVVKGGSYEDEYEFYVRTEITCKADGTKAETITKSKPLSTNPDGIVSAYDVAFYYLDSESRANALDAAVKELYEKIVATKQ